MSAPSGIKVPPSISQAFTDAQRDSEGVRALVFTIEGESFTHLTTVKPKGSYKDDIALLSPTLPSDKTPASFAYRLDSKELGKYEWMMVTFVPDDAGVRAKMLQASSRAGLMKALGAGNFKHDWFATQASDLTPSALTAHLNHLASPPPLSASEAALADVKAAEAEEAKRVALDPENEARRKKAVVGLAGKMQWDDEVEVALKKVSERSDDGWIVTLEIPASNPAGLTLLKSEACTPSQLASKLPPKSPSYTFYSYPTPPPPAPAPAPAPKATPATSAPRNTFQATAGGARPVAASFTPTPTADDAPGAPAEGEEPTDVNKPEAEDGKEESPEPEVKELSIQDESEVEVPPTPQPPVKGRAIFIYTCPPGSPIKYRMVYSSSVRGVQQAAADKAGMQIVSKLETSDISDLTESYLKSSLPTHKPIHSSSLPNPSSSARPFGSPAPGTGTGTGSGASQTPSFGGAFGRPRPVVTKSNTLNSASETPLPPSDPTSPTGEEGDSKDAIKRAFDAFGPRVGGGGSGGGFARPRPAGRR